MRSPLADRRIDVLVVVLAVAAQIEVWIDPELTPRALTTPAALLWTLPLLLRRRYPLAAPLAVFATIGLESLLEGDQVVHSVLNVFALVLTFCVAGTHPDERRALAGGAAGFLCLAAIVLNDVGRDDVQSAVVVFLIGAGAWAVGRALAERQRHADELTRQAAEQQRRHEAAALAERTRIAGDLHDVIAHSVSVMTIQAGAARMLLDEDLPRARAALAAVEETGHQALAEMRRLLGILRADDEPPDRDPQPGMAQLDALVDQVRRAGLRVDLTRDGSEQALPAGVDLAAYRVVQEALTNVLKHGGAGRATIEIRHDDGMLAIEVCDDGRSRPRADTTDGYGLIGMRQRVELYGGKLSAAPRTDGGFRVAASIPLHEPVT